MTVESWRVAPPGRGRVRGAHARARTSPGAEPTESAPGQRGVSKGRYRREHVRSRTGQSSQIGTRGNASTLVAMQKVVVRVPSSAPLSHSESPA
jgi:hypothetical protein